MFKSWLYKKSRIFFKCMYRLQNFTDNTCYSYLWRNKYFGIKSDKILPNINYVTTRLNGLAIISFKKWLLAKHKYENLISNYASKKLIRILKIYIIKSYI